MTSRTSFGWGRRGCGALGMCLLGVLSGGCPYQNGDGGAGDGDGAAQDGAARQNDSAGGSLPDATDVTFEGDQASFTASIQSSKDVDVFTLHELAPGDQIVIDVSARSAGLDTVAGVFDEEERLMAFNDDREPDASDLNPRIDFTLSGPRGAYFLAVAPFPGSGSTGDYLVSVTITRGVGTPDPDGQIVFLDWRGRTNVNIPNVGRFDLAPFDAADLGYEGQTALMKDTIQSYVLSRYAGFNFTLRNSDDHPTPVEPHSTVYFGGRSRSAFAISEQIDLGNSDASDDAIIFTESFQGAFRSTPPLEDMARAVGNTVAHEVGHLLGLVHTRDCADLMDTTCSNDSLLAEQAFSLAPLDESVFPFGFQDSAQLIAWVLGTL